MERSKSEQVRFRIEAAKGNVVFERKPLWWLPGLVLGFNITLLCVGIAIFYKITVAIMVTLALVAGNVLAMVVIDVSLRRKCTLASIRDLGQIAVNDDRYLADEILSVLIPLALRQSGNQTIALRSLLSFVHVNELSPEIVCQLSDDLLLTSPRAHFLLGHFFVEVDDSKRAKRHLVLALNGKGETAAKAVKLLSHLVDQNTLEDLVDQTDRPACAKSQLLGAVQKLYVRPKPSSAS